MDRHPIWLRAAATMSELPPWAIGANNQAAAAANRTALLKRNLRRKFPGEAMGNASAG